MGTTVNEDNILLAAINGDVRAVRRCVNKGENVNTRDTPSLFTRTPLHYAAGCGYDDVCELLLRNGADVNALDRNGRSPLLYAAKRGHNSICKMFVQHPRAVLDQPDKFGDTALLTAASWSSSGVCETLIRAGASALPKNQLDRTALHEASHAGNFEMCSALIDAGANLSAKDKEGNTALHIVCTKGYTQLCHLLLDCGADNKTQNQDGDTGLHCAAACENYKMCQVILQKGGDCNMRNKMGNTPLHIAASVNSADICSLFLTAGADCLIKNNNEKTARSMLLRKSGRAEKILLQAEKRQKYEKLVQIGTEPIHVVKLFLIGSPKAGKTTLQNSLVKKPQSWLPGKWQTLNDNGTDYQPTQGIELCTRYVPGAGSFAFWDCSGQLQYHVTHSMFLGAQNCIYVVVYDITQANRIGELRRWLAFVKAGHDYTYQNKPDVIIVATHFDQISRKFDGTALAGSIVKQISQEFGDFLNITSDVIAVNSINFGSKEMAQLRCVLQCVASRIKGRRVMPRLCDEIRRVKHRWYKAGFPVISWNEFCCKVKSINRLVDDSLQRTAAIFLTDISEIYFKKEYGDQDWVVLNPKWLSREIIGRLFVGDEVTNSSNQLVNKQLYSVSDIRASLQEVTDIHRVLDLLEHLELVYQYDEAHYIIPAKLPTDLNPVVWSRDTNFTVYYGRRIECKDVTDIFTPDVFPSLQVCIMRRFCSGTGEVQISRKSIKFSCKIEGFIQLTRYQKAINICVRGRPCLEDRKACYNQMEQVLEMVQSELEHRSPGTAVNICYLSPRSLMQHDDLEDASYYTQKDIEMAKGGAVLHPKTGQTELLADIMCIGYDPTLLCQHGFKCKSIWLLEDDLKALCKCLDVVHPLGQDYRALAEALNVSEAELDRIYQICLHKGSSPTRTLLDRFQPRMQHLRAICKHPGLVACNEAANIIDSALGKYGHKVNHKEPKCIVEEKFLPENVNSEVLIWREDLRLQASRLRATLHPELLLACSPLLFDSNDREQIQATMKSLGRTKAVERMLYTVLKSQSVRIYHEFYTALEMQECCGKDAKMEVIPDSSGLYVNHTIPPAHPSRIMLDPINNYCMWTGRKGLAYVLNNSKLKNKERHGSDVDLVNICHVLRELGYVLQVHTNLTAKETSDSLVKFTRRFEGNDYCSSVVVLMSHGKSGIITGSDQKAIQLKHIYSLFEGHRCPALFGKPKLFFVQACRAGSEALVEADADVSEYEDECQSDCEEETITDICPDYSFGHDLPANADMFFAYATTEGRQSLRSQVDGSWFIQALCEVFIQRASWDSLDDLMNKVTNRVARQRGQIWDPATGKPKTAWQTPECLKRMRKTMYFLPKYP